MFCSFSQRRAQRGLAVMLCLLLGVGCTIGEIEKHLETKLTDAQKDGIHVGGIFVTSSGATADPGPDPSPNGSATNVQTNGAVTLSTKDVPAAGTLAVYTPTAPFRGNQNAIVGAALKPTSNLAGTVLLRQADCKLIQYSFADTLLGAIPTLTTLTGFEAHIQKVAGLGTAAATYPKGCADRRLGTSSVPTAYLGRAANGDLLAVGSNFSQQFSITRVDVAGKILSRTNIGNTSSAPTVATADLNGDGIADVVTPYITSGGQSGIGVYLSNASGSFGAVTVYPGLPADANKFYARASIDDINGDGIPDIVVLAGAGLSTPSIVTLLGTGSGTFTAGTVATKQMLVGPIVLADFNGDGKSDLLAGGYFVAGLGNGAFGTPVAGPAGLYFAVGDVNADGKLDVVTTATGAGRMITVLLGNGDGTFTKRASYAAVSGAEYLSITDIDGDGKLDIFVGLGGSGAFAPNHLSATVMQFLLGRGDGTFSGAQALADVGGSQLYTGAPTLALADFNGDGYPDLIAPSPGNVASMVLRPGAASGQFGAAATPISLSFKPLFVASGDVNGDGKPDAIAISAGRLMVLPGTGGGNFGAEQSYALPAVAGQPSNLAVGDINADGRGDIVITMQRQSAATGGAFAYIANTDGTLKTPVQIDSATNLGALAVADLTGDGRADIVIGGNDGQFYTSGNVLNGVRVYRSNADGSFTASATITQAGAVIYPSVAIADMNKDGKADLVFASKSSGLNDSISVASGNGDGSFAAPVALPLPDGGPGVQAIAVADFTFDGNLDVMLAAGDYAAVVTGNGNGTLGAMSVLIIASGGVYVAAADLNKDAVPDAVMATGQGAVILVRTKSALDGSSGTTSGSSFVATAPASQTVAAGQSVNVVVTLTPTASFSGTVSLSCTGLPAGASCSFTPASLNLGTTAASSTMTITTTARAVALMPGSLDGNVPPAAGGVALAGGLAAILLRRLGWLRPRNRRQGWRQYWRQFAWPTLLAVTLLSVLNACGGGGGGGGGGSSSATLTTGTPAGTYTVTINAVGAASSYSSNFALTVN